MKRASVFRLWANVSRASVRPAALLALASLLSACVGSAEVPAIDFGQTSAPKQVAAIASREPQGPLFALPAAAGRVRLTSRRGEGDAQRQTLAFGAGEEAVAVVLTHTTAQPSLDRALGTKPSEAAIKAELAAQFPGTFLEPAGRPLANAYGPYGLATGRDGQGRTCAYAWQWIEDQAVLAPQGLTGPVAWRVRLCLAGRSVAEVTTWLGQVTLGQSAGPAALEAAPERKHKITRRAAGAGRHVAVQVPLHRDGAPQYMAPVPGGFAQTLGSATDPAVEPATNLPPQATRGPQGAGGRS